MPFMSGAASGASVTPNTTEEPCNALTGVNLCINGNLPKVLNASVVGGTYVSGITATGTTGQTCEISFTNGGGTGGTATVALTGTNTIAQNANLVIVSPGNGYTTLPTTASVIAGGTASCTGSAVTVTTKWDILGLAGTLFTATTTINPDNVIYNPTSITYNGLTIALAAGLPGTPPLSLSCTGATGVITVNDPTDGGNDTFKLSNCLLAGNLATFTATVAFPPNTIPAPIPLALGASIVTTPATASEGVYVLSSSGAATTLSIAGGITSTCVNCPSGSVSYTGSPNPISFSVPQNGPAPTPVSVTANTSDNSVLAYAATTSTTPPGQTWLTVNGAAMTGGNTGGATGSFNVSVNPAGLLPGNYTGTVAVWDATCPTALCTAPALSKVTVNLTISAASPPTITTPSLPGGEVGAPYSQQLAATGGTPPYNSWTVSTGTLPAGLTLNSSTGLISGTPTATSTANFSLTVKDSAGSTSAPKAFTIVVIAGPTVSTSSLPGGAVGVAYNQTLAATGGTPPYSSWTVSVGALPAGLSLNASTGAITGTPSTAGTSTFSVTVKDSVNSISPLKQLSIVIGTGLTITTTSLPGGEVGLAYSQQLAATGGTTPYTWAVTTGTLPAGLTLSTGGLISGTPTAAGNPSFTVTATDSASHTAQQVLSINVLAAVTVQTSSLPGGTVNTPYSQTLTATGGQSPYNTWTVSVGTLPAGLSLNASSGVISGTPTAAGTSTFSVTVKDSLGVTSAPKSLSITIASALTITTTSLPGGEVGAAYSQTLQASGGTAPYTWAVTTGSLPAGLSLNASSGAITGTPSSVVSSSFTVTVTDSANHTAQQALSINVIAGPVITTTSPLTNGALGSPYSHTLAAAGGTQPYSNWIVTSGTLPAGLSLSSSTGAISGTPTTAGTSTFSVTVTDNVGSTSAPVSLSLTIVNGLTITTTSLPNGTTGVAYNQTLQAAGGTPPYSNWTVTVGTLPAGLSLNASSGAITGTPSTAGASTFSVTVKDSANTTSAAQQLTITIVGPLTITTTTLPAGTVGTAYSQTLQATGGTAPYNTWTVATGSLPAGLTLNASTGTISGTPTAAGTSNFTVTVKDSANLTSPPASLSIVVNAPALTITTTTLPAGSVGVAYSQTLTAQGGTPPYTTWTLTSGSLPAGLTLNASTGVISGTPTAAGTSPFSVTVKDSANVTSSAANLSITVNAGVAITTTSPLPAGAVGTAYTDTLTATGGTPPYSNWTVTTGSLPAGLTLNASTGAISGTPTTPGTSTFSVTVKDNAGLTSPAVSLSLTITGKVTVTTTTLPGATVGIAYNTTLAASGGTGPYSSWTVTTGSLPAGLTLNAATGAISGTPATAGTSTFSVTVKDSLGATSTPQALSIVVAPALSISTSSLLSGVIGVPYNQTLLATGGTPPYSNWTVTGGSLPPGLTLNAATGNISGTPTTVTGSPFTFTVSVGDGAGSTASKSLSISIGTATLKIAPGSNFTFTLANTSAPATSQVTIVASDGSAQPVTVTAGPTQFNWLSFTPKSGNTPLVITLTANPAGLLPGTYLSPLTVTSGSLTLTIPAQLTVTGSNLATNPTTLTFSYQPGVPPPPSQTLALTVINGAGPIALTSVTTNVSWLTVTNATSAPATLTVSVTGSGLSAPGSYLGAVIIKGVGSPNVLEVPVTVNVTSAQQIAAAPAALNFTYQLGGAAPAAQSFSVTAGNTPLSFTATSPGSWVQLSPATGTTPGTVMVTINPAGLGAGTFTGTINVKAVGASNTATVAVTLTVTGPPALAFAPASLTFSAQAGGPAPAAQTLSVTSTSSPLTFTAAAGSFWLTVTPSSGTTPAMLTVSVNPATLQNGTYTGTVNITPAGSAVAQMVIVTLQVGPASATPTIAGVINSASGVVGNVSPGMAIGIFGTNLGPVTGVPFTPVTGAATVATTLGGTQVLFDGTAAPLLYSSEGQVNALAPFELGNKATTVVTVTYAGGTSVGATLTVLPSEPGIFAANGMGTGQGSILNQDFGINSDSNPAAAGTYIMVFGTGGGLTTPDSVDGALNPLTSTGQLQLPTTATINGQPATVQYSGPAPGLVAGIIQVNLLIPEGTPSGDQPVVIKVGDVTSQTVTVAVGTVATPGSAASKKK